MKTLKIKMNLPLMLSFIALLFVGLNANAQERNNYEDMRNTTAEDYANQQTDRMMNDLDIDDAQRQEIYDMNLRYANQQIPIANSDMSQEDMNNRMRSIESARDRDYKKVLNDDQYKRYSESRNNNNNNKSNQNKTRDRQTNPSTPR